MSNKLLKSMAGAAAAVAVVLGAAAIGNAGSDGTSAPAGAQQTASGNGGQAPSTASGGQQGVPPGGPGGMAEVTGTAAEKVSKAALAAHAGTIERVEQLPDGSYVAHVMTDDGEVYVAVSEAFKVTGAAQGGFGGPRGGGVAPPAAGSQSSSGSGSGTSA